MASGIRTSSDDDDNNDLLSDASSDRYQKRAVLKNFASFLNRPASILSRFTSTSKPVMVTMDHFVGTLGHPSCYWVYARFSDPKYFVNQFLYALDIKEKNYALLPNPPLNSLVDNASAVLDCNLYLIGGQRGQYVHNLVHAFEPVLHEWSETNEGILPRTAALAASVDGKVYVFGGGCDIHVDRWGEVYDPSTKTWTQIPSSEALIHALDNGLYSLRTSAVLGKKIILRGSPSAIAFDVLSSSWTSVSDRLIQGWWNCVRAAVVQNLLITCYSEYCYSEYDEHRILVRSIRAYDPDEDVWLLIKGIGKRFHKNAYRSHFLSVNGKLVIYHMWKKNDLRFSIFEIKERRRTSVRANLLWKSRFPIAKLIKEGNYLTLSGLDIRPHKRLYRESVIEAVRADALES